MRNHFIEKNTNTGSDMTLSSNYKMELRKYQTPILSNALIVSCSHKANYAFYKYPFDIDTLFISDLRSTYFTYLAGTLARKISDIVALQGYDRICFVGCSKGGYGSILLSSLVGEIASAIRCSFLSFAPQTRIFPQNNNLSFPSYRKLIELANRDRKIYDCLILYGDLSKYLAKKEAHGRIIWSENNRKDNNEIQRILSYAGPGVIKMAMPFSFHATALPFYIDYSDESTLSRALEKLMPNQRDEDVSENIDNISKIKKEIESCKYLPTLKDLIYLNFQERH